MTFPSAAEISRAVDELRAGRAVVIPTDTVYGLAADPMNPRGVEALFALKGRPAENPIPLLVDSNETAKCCAACWPEGAELLARAFWPGPLTIVLESAGAIPVSITAGKGTVGLRQPDHPVALEILEAFGGPIACTSANESGKPAVHQISDIPHLFFERGVYSVDVGTLPGAESSTVVRVSDKGTPVVLRDGFVTQNQILEVLTHSGG